MRKPTFLVLTIMLLAGGIAFLKQRSTIAEHRTMLQLHSARLHTLRQETTTLEHDLAALTAAFHEQERALASARISQSLESKALTRVDPESLWAEPPPLLPDWQPGSPYVWLSKDTLAMLPWDAFTRDGQLTPDLAAILTLDEEEIAEVNRVARKVLKEYRDMENHHVRASTNHLAGILEAEGPKYTIEIQPPVKEGARLKTEFEASLVAALGEVRAEFLQHEAASWISMELSNFALLPRTISVAYIRPDYYQIGVQSGTGWRSTGGKFDQLSIYIPPHLIPHFEHLRQEPPPELTTTH